MKGFLFCLSFAAVFIALTICLTDEQKETLRKHHKECVNETEVDIEKVNLIRHGNWSNSDEDLQLYIFCMLRKSDLISEDGEFNKDVAMSKVPEDADRDAIEAAIDACMSEKGETPHESAYLMVKCYHEKKTDHDIM